MQPTKGAPGSLVTAWNALKRIRIGGFPELGGLPELGMPFRKFFLHKDYQDSGFINQLYRALTWAV